MLLIGPLIDRLGPRRVMLAGAVIAGVGFLALSLAKSLWMLYLTYGVLLGLGFAALFPPAAQTSFVAAALFFFARAPSLPSRASAPK